MMPQIKMMPASAGKKAAQACFDWQSQHTHTEDIAGDQEHTTK
jgi:hypothetical protein